MGKEGKEGIGLRRALAYLTFLRSVIGRVRSEHKNRKESSYFLGTLPIKHIAVLIKMRYSKFCYDRTESTHNSNRLYHRETSETL